MITATMMGSISDEQLFLAISKGSESAFRLIFERYYRRMWSFAVTLVKFPHIAGDIVQEAFIKLWECREMLADVKKPDDFIFILVRNHALNSFRNLGREERGKLRLREHLKQYAVHENYWLEAEQAMHILEQIIARLPAQQQKVIRLSRELGLSHQDIADQLKISKNTVNKHLSIALKTCREQLKRMGFSYFFILPLLITAPFGVFIKDNKKWSDENNKETGKERMEKVHYQHLQRKRV